MKSLLPIVVAVAVVAVVAGAVVLMHDDEEEPPEWEGMTIEYIISSVRMYDDVDECHALIYFDPVLVEGMDVGFYYANELIGTYHVTGDTISVNVVIDPPAGVPLDELRRGMVALIDGCNMVRTLSFSESPR